MNAVKRPVALLCALACLLLCIPITAAESEPAVKFALSETVAVPGEEISVSLTYSDSTGFAGLIADLTYDSRILAPIYDKTIAECLSTKVGCNAISLTENAAENSATLTIGFAKTKNILGSGTLGTLKFRVLADAPCGESTITLALHESVKNLTDENAKSIPGSFTDGTVIVQEMLAKDKNGKLLSTLPQDSFTVTVPAAGNSVVLAMYDTDGKSVQIQQTTVSEQKTVTFEIDNQTGAGKTLKVLTLDKDWKPVGAAKCFPANG